MSQNSTKTDLTCYEIHVSGRLNPEWAGWFENMALTVQPAPDGSIHTILAGPVVDQAALFGILTRIRDLGLKLVSVNRLLPGQAEGIYEE